MSNNKKKKTKYLRAISFILMLSLLFSGCEIMGKKVYLKTGASKDDLFMIGDLSSPKEEIKTYILNEKNIYLSVDDNPLFSEDFKTDSMEESIKEDSLSHLIRVYALLAIAKKDGYELSDEEKEKVNTASSIYFDSLNDDEKEYLGVSLEDIKKMYERYALSEKVYFDLIGDVDEEVSEDEARVMEAEVFYVTDDDIKNEVINALSAGKDFSSVAASYNEGKENGVISFTRNVYPKEFDDVVFRMENDEISDAISCSDGKIYFVKCVNKFNEELSEANKKNVVESRRQDVIDEITGELNTYYSDFNEELFSTLDFPTGKNLTSGTFFKVLDDNLVFE